MSHSTIEPERLRTHPPSPPPADASVGDLVKAMSADLSRLVRNEIQLAQTEISAKIKTGRHRRRRLRRGRGAGPLRAGAS